MSLHRMLAAVLVAAGVGGLSNAALGADASPYNWTGFYAGVQGGYGWDQGSVNRSAVDTFNYPDLLTFNQIPTSQSLSGKGFLGGIEGGYNYQYGRAVFGVEADFSYSGVRASNTFYYPGDGFAAGPITTDTDKKLEWFGTLRGRLGLLPTSSTLAYVTAGLAYGKAVASTTTTATFGGLDMCPPPFNNAECSNGSTSAVRTGWTLGAGLESMIAPNWSVKAEYLYYDLGRSSYTSYAMVGIGNTLAPAMETSVHFNGSIARVGLNYQFH